MASVASSGLNRFCFVALPLVASCLSRTSRGSINDAVYGAYDARRISSSPSTGSLSGGKLGYEARQSDSPLAGMIEGGILIAGTGGLSIFSVGVGGKFAALRGGSLELGVMGLLEFQRLRLDKFQNANDLVAIGVGLYGEFRVAPSVALTLTLSASGFFDATPPTTCNDGSTSQSTGSGTCSWHDGIAFYNDMLGDGTTLDALLGLSVWFGGDSNGR